MTQESEALRILETRNPIQGKHFVIPETIVSKQLCANNDSKLISRRKQTDWFDILWEPQYSFGFSSHLFYFLWHVYCTS